MENTFNVHQATQYVKEKIKGDIKYRTLQEYIAPERYGRLLHPLKDGQGSIQWTARDVDIAAWIWTKIHTDKWAKEKIIEEGLKIWPSAEEGETVIETEHKDTNNKAAQVAPGTSLAQYQPKGFITELEKSYRENLEAHENQVQELHKVIKEIANENLRLQSRVDELELKYGERGVLNKAMYKLGLIKVQKKEAK